MRRACATMRRTLKGRSASFRAGASPLCGAGLSCSASSHREMRFDPASRPLGFHPAQHGSPGCTGGHDEGAFPWPGMAGPDVRRGYATDGPARRTGPLLAHGAACGPVGQAGSATVSSAATELGHRMSLLGRHDEFVDGDTGRSTVARLRPDGRAARSLVIGGLMGITDGRPKSGFGTRRPSTSTRNTIDRSQS